MSLIGRGARHRHCLRVEHLEPRALLAFTVAEASVILPTESSASIVDFGSEWKYLDNGNDQALAWRQPGFDDGAWASGRGQLGFGEGDEQTVISCGPSAPGCHTDNHPTFYFRHSFDIPDSSSIAGLSATLIRWDAAAVYLNGSEVFRDRGLAPDATFEDFATTFSFFPNETVHFDVDSNLLQPKNNLLAVEVHQWVSASRPLSFDLELQASTLLSSGAVVELVFSDPADANSIDAGDVMVDGVPARHVTIVDDFTAEYELPELVGSGPYQVSVPNGKISQASPENTAIGDFEFTFDTRIPSQYAVKHEPRLQLGNAPLSPFPGSETDQVEVLWQTVPAGLGDRDAFAVQYRREGTSEPWIDASLNSVIDTGVQDRVVHSATIRGLDYDADYQYRVRHFRGPLVVNSYQHAFHTRLPVGSEKPFSFATYGDSANLSTLNDFRNVMRQINRTEADFAVLLGDAVYHVGRHDEADSRFDAQLNPEAAQWISNHVDYFGIGNHDAVTDGGKPSRENFSVPIPVAGVNSITEPPANQPRERNYSFDYGDVHFVTYDTNLLNSPVALDQVLTWVEQDLAASSARWKIVFGHHPVAFAPDKPESPSGNYYQQVVPRMLAADVDLLMYGHSHTFGWTKPLLGQVDGVATFIDDNDKVYEKREGLVQLISGVGGRSLRRGVFGDPAVASAFSLDTEPRVQFGFALVEVSPSRLQMQYISAVDGSVMDSFSIVDSDLVTGEPQPLTAQFANVVPNPRIQDLDDISLLFSTDVVGLDLGQLQLSRNGHDLDLSAAANLSTLDNRLWTMDNLASLTSQPGNYHLRVRSDAGITDQTGNLLTHDVSQTWTDVRRAGDSNTDGRFDQLDLIAALRGDRYRSGQVASWAQGDWNGDGLFDQDDVIAALQEGTYLQGPYFALARMQP